MRHWLPARTATEPGRARRSAGTRNLMGCAVLLWLALGLSLPAAAVEPVEWQPLSDEALETLAGPVALYPDDLLAIVLPASTYPLQVVQAARLLDDLEHDPSLTPDPDWDESVVALLNYPDVVTLLNDDLDWTWELGQAVLHQEADLIDAIARFRDDSRSAGNLASDEYQRVEVNDDTIAIVPVDPAVIYVPSYRPELVRLRQYTTVFSYYPRPCPVYYYPYPLGYYSDVFDRDPFWGVSSVFSIGWHTHHLHLQPYGYSHPYFGHPYAYRYDHYWRPRLAARDYFRDHPGARQHDDNRWQSHWRSRYDGPHGRLSYEGRRPPRDGRRDDRDHGNDHRHDRPARGNDRRSAAPTTPPARMVTVPRSPRRDAQVLASGHRGDNRGTTIRTEPRRSPSVPEPRIGDHPSRTNVSVDSARRAAMIDAPAASVRRAMSNAARAAQIQAQVSPSAPTSVRSTSRQSSRMAMPAPAARRPAPAPAPRPRPTVQRNAGPGNGAAGKAAPRALSRREAAAERPRPGAEARGYARGPAVRPR